MFYKGVRYNTIPENILVNFLSSQKMYIPIHIKVNLD